MTLDIILVRSPPTDPTNAISDTNDRKKALYLLNLAPANGWIDRNAAIRKQSAAAREYDAEQPRTQNAADSALHGSNENKISDGWLGGAWLRVEGGIS